MATDTRLNDILETPEYEVYIRAFCSLTNSDFTLAALAPITESFKESKILEYLMRDSTHTHALTCFKQIIQSRPYLPQEFIGRFLSVYSMKINVMANQIGISNQSFVTKVVVNNIKPPTPLTNFTVNALRDQLREDIKKSTMHVVAVPTVPTEIKLNLNQTTMNYAINSMCDLARTIQEGNRKQGRECDSYIRQQIKYK
ncbi:GbNV_gp75-like [Fopius arisanus]|nr:GbNV_gp75-like [Fopius arisanus]